MTSPACHLCPRPATPAEPGSWLRLCPQCREHLEGDQVGHRLMKLVDELVKFIHGGEAVGAFTVTPTLPTGRTLEARGMLFADHLVVRVWGAADQVEQNRAMRLLRDALGELLASTAERGENCKRAAH